MPTEINTFLTTPGVAFRFQEPDDFLTVLRSGALISTSKSAILSQRSGETIQNSGLIHAGIAPAIVMDGDHVRIINAADGIISNLGQLGYAAIFVGGFQSEIRNSGVLTSNHGGAVWAAGIGATAYNDGYLAGDGFGIYFGAQSQRLENDGDLISASGDFGSGAVQARYDDVVIDNDGRISAFGDGAAGVYVGAEAGYAVPLQVGPYDLGGGYLLNRGIISSAGGYGFQGGSARFLVWNLGEISGQLGSYAGSQQGDHLANGGTMIGDILLFGGNDVFDGMGGTVAGRVLGGLGNDVFRVSDADVQIVELQGQGRDRIESSVSFDMALIQNVESLKLLGNAALNALGNSEANTLIGNAGANSIGGADGYDQLVGRQGDDLLYGGSGEDQLFGGSGGDVLAGGDGDDRLTGGKGSDLQSGGAGADVFYFLAATDSRAGAGADTIADFTSGLDRINLAGIDGDPQVAGDQALVFLGDAAFGSHAGQVRYAAGVLEIDLDGDGGADMQIVLSGMPVLVANDLSL